MISPRDAFDMYEIRIRLASCIFFLSAAAQTYCVEIQWVVLLVGFLCAANFFRSSRLMLPIVYTKNYTNKFRRPFSHRFGRSVGLFFTIVENTTRYNIILLL